MKNQDRYNVVIKDGIVYATIDSVDIEMTLDDFDKFAKMVDFASKSDLGAAYVDDEGVARPIFTEKAFYKGKS